MHPGDRRNAERGVFEELAEFRGSIFTGLKAQHADDKSEAILYPVVHFLDKELMTLEGSFYIALVTFALDRHPQYVGRALQEREVMLDELVFRPAVDLENSEWPPISL